MRSCWIIPVAADDCPSSGPPRATDLERPIISLTEGLCVSARWYTMPALESAAAVLGLVTTLLIGLGVGPLAVDLGRRLRDLPDDDVSSALKLAKGDGGARWIGIYEQLFFFATLAAGQPGSVAAWLMSLVKYSD